ncbi:MAG: hypothetical protein AAB426_13555 [Myxococcota bacterium]
MATTNAKRIKAVYTTIEDEKLERPLFRRLGTAFVNRDGSLNVFLDALPVNGKLHIRDLADKEDKAGEPEGR